MVPNNVLVQEQILTFDSNNDKSEVFYETAGVIKPMARVYSTAKQTFKPHTLFIGTIFEQ